MADALLRVRFAGPHVSIQDEGRPGWARFGVPQSGAMDRLAMRAANIALGNPSGAPVIEVSRGGLQIECHSGAAGFALAGGGFIVDHAGKPSGSWSSGVLKAGEHLTIRPGYWGNWCCLALAGQIVAERWLESAATHGLSGLGGGKILTGSEIRVSAARETQAHPAIPCPVFARPGRVVRAIPGPQERFFEPDSIELLFKSRWRITSAADRMGTRLAGPALTLRARLDMASEPLTRGSVQVAGDGVATILTADHQTTGGYPRIATVLDCDLDAFAQAAPGQDLFFEPVSAEQAITAARDHQRAVARYINTLTQRHGF